MSCRRQLAGNWHKVGRESPQKQVLGSPSRWHWQTFSTAWNATRCFEVSACRNDRVGAGDTLLIYRLAEESRTRVACWGQAQMMHLVTTEMALI